MDDESKLRDGAADALDWLDEEARRSRLVVHLALLVGRGATVEEQLGVRAVVSVRRPASGVPNVAMAAAGAVLFWWLGQPLFVLGAAVALLGWHRKLAARAERVRLMVRVDDLVRVTEHELGAA